MFRSDWAQFIDSLNASGQPYLDFQDWERRIQSQTPPQEAVDAVACKLAWLLQSRAQDALSGKQHRGLLDSPLAMVAEAWPAFCAARFMESFVPGPAAGAQLQTALEALRRALERGVEFYQYDRPGYDNITAIYSGLLKHLRRL